MPYNHGKSGLSIFNKRRILWLLSSILCLFFAGLTIVSIGWYKDYQNIPKDHLIGNRGSNVNRLKEGGFPFSFLVIGDTHGRGKAKKLIETALKEGTPSFMIILGDIVRKPDLWNHRFFLTEMTMEIKPPFPVFLVPGNHDIDYTSSKIRQDERRVTSQVYESLYAARNFDFIFNNCLFIIGEVGSRDHTRYLNYLRDTLSKKGKDRKYIFVFTHTPPKGLAEFIPGFGYGEEFFSLLETYHATACFFGNFHGYWRGQKKGVNIIVSGGGGGRLKKSSPEWVKFHHILKVNVDENILSEEMMVLKGWVFFENVLNEWIFTRLFPIIQNRGWILYLGVILFSSLGIYSAFVFFFRGKWNGTN